MYRGDGDGGAEARSGDGEGAPGAGITGGCELLSWLLGTKVRSSGRAVTTLDNWAISLVLQ